MKKDYMTVRGGVGPKNGDSIYRNLKKGKKEDIIFVEKNGLVFRDILEQDVPLVQDASAAARQGLNMLVRDKITGNYDVMPAEKVYALPTEEEILKKIQSINREDGTFTLAVFAAKTKQFIAIFDVETIKDSEFTECTAQFFFTKNKVTRQTYENKVKVAFNQLCKESWLFKNGCKEKVKNGDHYELREIVA